MEGILIPAIIYVLSIVFKSFFKEGEDENAETKKEGSLLKNVNDTFEKIKTNLNESSYDEKKQKYMKKFKKEYKELNKNTGETISPIVTEDIEDTQNLKDLNKNINQEETIDTDCQRNTKNINSDKVFDLFSDSDDLIRGIVMSEILSKPKSMRR
ncbi:hypothetical protein [Tepidibacter hydrothermalis]|uniref:Uncharacterized protein n=1 Tax=Tepidibacter hydrothermalis TaxID=3036126 RepID=A0ABY8EI43_9FIRM|nr:hypothetical protein [Tepidibacter hydrothermalis]WFD11590.1 hypothetical protein P4S50_05805 [Tepidibacter hydrothermalis]